MFEQTVRGLKNLFGMLVSVLSDTQTSRGHLRRRTILKFEELENRICPDITWTGAGANDLWSNPANWDLTRVPVATEKIVFDAGNLNSKMDMTFNQALTDLEIDGFAGKLTLTKDISAGHVALSAPGKIGGNATLTIAAGGQFTWFGGSIGGGTGSLVVEPSATLRIRAPIQGDFFSGTLDEWSLHNHGATFWNNKGGGKIDVTNGGTIINEESANFAITADSTKMVAFTISGTGAGGSSFTNLGSVWSIQGHQENILNFEIEVISLGGTWGSGDQNGLQGTTIFSYSSIINSSNFKVAKNARLSFTSPAKQSHDFDGNNGIMGDGTLKFLPGVFTVSDQLTLDISQAYQLAGTIAGEGKVTINSTFTYNGGLWDGFGVMEIGPGGNLVMDDRDVGPIPVNRGIRNSGSIVVPVTAMGMALRFRAGADIINRIDGNILFLLTAAQ